MTTWFSSVQKMVHDLVYWRTQGTAVGLVTEDCIVLFDCMLISILSISIEAADALHPGSRDLKSEDVKSPSHLMCVFK